MVVFVYECLGEERRMRDWRARSILERQRISLCSILAYSSCNHLGSLDDQARLFIVAPILGPMSHLESGTQRA